MRQSLYARVFSEINLSIHNIRSLALTILGLTTHPASKRESVLWPPCMIRILTSKKRQNTFWLHVDNWWCLFRVFWVREFVEGCCFCIKNLGELKRYYLCKYVLHHRDTL